MKHFWFDKCDDVKALRAEIRHLMSAIVDTQTAQAASNEYRPNAPFMLQLVALGMLVGNPSLRKKGASKAFIDLQIAAAVAELESARGRTGWPALKGVFEILHVEWDERKPMVDQLVNRLKLDAETARVLDYLGVAAAGLSERTISDAAKKRFLKMVANAPETLNLTPSPAQPQPQE